jgi:hypothetical protein
LIIAKTRFFKNTNKANKNEGRDLILYGNRRQLIGESTSAKNLTFHLIRYLGKQTLPILTLGTPCPKLVLPPQSVSFAKIANKTASFASGLMPKVFVL